MKLLALLLFVLAGQSVQAQTGSATLSWNPPTQNTDGTPLTNLTGYKVYYGTSPTALAQSKPVGANSPTTTITGLAASSWYFAVSAVTATAESTLSNVVSKLIAGAAPNPPTIPQPVTSAGLVFTLQVTDDSLVLPQVGTVQAGKPCDPTQQIAFLGKTYMLVPKASVVPLAGMQVIAAWSDTCH